MRTIRTDDYGKIEFEPALTAVGASNDVASFFDGISVRRHSIGDMAGEGFTTVATSDEQPDGYSKEMVDLLLALEAKGPVKVFKNADKALKWLRTKEK